ncbi:MAG: hypothetical protein AVDCRST_MAG56-1827, partial [uncultured Cytophagales bacterium]
CVLTGYSYWQCCWPMRLSPSAGPTLSSFSPTT